MADTFPPMMRSEQAIRPLLYEFVGTVVEDGDVVGGRVGWGVSRVGVGVTISVGVADVGVGSFPPQADTTIINTPMPLQNI